MIARFFRTATLVVAVLAALANPSAAAERLDSLVAEAAAKLAKKVPARSAVALIPINPDDSGLPGEATRQIHNKMTAALLKALDGKAQLVARARLQDVWREAEEFHGPDIQVLLNDAAADTVIYGEVMPKRAGFEIVFRSYSVRSGEIGKVIAQYGPALLAKRDVRYGLGALSTEIERAGAVLARNLHRRFSRFDGAAELSFTPIGTTSGFSDYVFELLAQSVGRNYARPDGTEQPASREKKLAATGLNLNLRVWDHRSSVIVSASLSNGRGWNSKHVLRVDPASIPKHFMPLTKSGGEVGAGSFQAMGQARVSENLPHTEAVLAARMHARARLVATALNLSPPRQPEVERRSDYADLTTRLARAFSFEEQWRPQAANQNGVVAEHLTARVKKMGSDLAPQVRAWTDHKIYRTGEPLRISVEGKSKTSFLTVFALQADGSVVRLYPARGSEHLSLPANTRMELPTAGEPEYSVAPMPDRRENSEAVFVLASRSSQPFHKLAPPAAATASGSINRAVDLGGFFDQLAAFDLSHVRMIVLPYQVRRK